MSTISPRVIREKQFIASNAMLEAVASADATTLRHAVKAFNELNGMTTAMLARMIAADKEMSETDKLLREIIMKRDELGETIKAQAERVRDVMKMDRNYLTKDMFDLLVDIASSLDAIHGSLDDAEPEEDDSEGLGSVVIGSQSGGSEK